MTLKGNVSEGSWGVVVETSEAPGGGYHCNVQVTHGAGEHGAFTHHFTHHQTFASEREAVLEGLREGMTWIELKRMKAFDV